MSGRWNEWPARAPSAGFAARVAAAARREHAARSRRRSVILALGSIAAAAALVLIALRPLRPADRLLFAKSPALRARPPSPPALIVPDDRETFASRSFAWPTSPAWGGPRFAFPLEFAPSLPYRGAVLTHMAPDFDTRGTPDHWTYVAVWLTEGGRDADPADLARDLETYYTGLCGTSGHPGIYTRVVPRESTVTLHAAPLDDEDRDAGGRSAVRGDVLAPQCRMTGGDLKLHVEGVTGECDDGGSFVAYALSPMPYEHPIWRDVRSERRAFRCARR